MHYAALIIAAKLVTYVNVCGRTAAAETNASNMTDLLHVAGEVGKAVESLVTIMTDEEQQNQNGEHGTSSQ